MSAPIVLEARNITKSFGVTPVLRNLDFKLPLGSRYAIMGPSGSGKSTFLNCCSGIEHPDSGSLTITGTELSDSSPNELVELKGNEALATFFSPSTSFRHLLPLKISNCQFNYLDYPSLNAAIV